MEGGRVTIFAAPAKTGREPQTGLAGEIGDMVKAVLPMMFAQSPRSLQTELGASEIGVECDLQLAYKVLDWPKVEGCGHDPFPAIVGTAGHAWLAEQYRKLDQILGGGRFLVEPGIMAGPVPGHVDLYDRQKGIVIDWKFVGVDAMRVAKRDGPKATYRTQAHIYGYGLEAMGELPNDVAIVYFSRGGLLSGLHVWTEPYDSLAAIAALERLEQVKVAAMFVDSDGRGLQSIEATPGDACHWCPYHLPGSEDLAAGCPGK
jgi:hypothetical protein